MKVRTLLNAWYDGPSPSGLWTYSSHISSMFHIDDKWLISVQCLVCVYVQIKNDEKGETSLCPLGLNWPPRIAFQMKVTLQERAFPEETLGRAEQYVWDTKGKKKVVGYVQRFCNRPLSQSYVLGIQIQTLARICGTSALLQNRFFLFVSSLLYQFLFDIGIHRSMCADADVCTTASSHRHSFFYAVATITSLHLTLQENHKKREGKESIVFHRFALVSAAYLRPIRITLWGRVFPYIDRCNA